MIYSIVLAFLLLNPFGEKVNFTVYNDTSEVVSIAVDNMPALTLQPASTSDMRISKEESVYYILDTEGYKRIALFEVDETIDGKEIKLKRLINQAKKSARP